MLSISPSNLSGDFSRRTVCHAIFFPSTVRLEKSLERFEDDIDNIFYDPINSKLLEDSM